MTTTDDLKRWLEDKVKEFNNPQDDYEEGLLDAYTLVLSQVEKVLGA
jgi:hypothetical protein